MKKLIVATLIGSTLLASGCATQTGLIAKRNVQTIPTSSKSQPFYFWGIGQEKTTDAVAVCGSADKVGKVQTVWEPMDIILGTITFGIYVPRTANVYCQK